MFLFCFLLSEIKIRLEQIGKILAGGLLVVRLVIRFIVSTAAFVIVVVIHAVFHTESLDTSTSIGAVTTKQRRQRSETTPFGQTKRSRSVHRLAVHIGFAVLREGGGGKGEGKGER